MTNLRFDHVDSGHRFFIVLLSMSMFVDMLHPVILIFGDHGSRTFHAAATTGYPAAIAGLFLLCAFAMVPNMVVTAIEAPNRRVLKLATFGASLSSCSWVFMAYLSRDMARGWLIGEFLINAAINLALAAAFALMLNKQLADFRNTQR
jgi:hypothetical protein